ncbi:MAG TPA: phospholipase D-like domain-containing protein [Caulobacteraceae bacterium]|nr:phospholipase D-like domain-containing protein [Caulobacteraceae bacterium]
MGLLRPGETCWRVAQRGRVKFLVDGQAYFRAVAEAISRARRSIHLLGWSFDPRVVLTPEDADAVGLGRALIDLSRASPALDIRLLIWRSALPIAATQEFFPHRARAWFQGTNVRFELDDMVPLGACHHQKIVVVDDALAFVGGADFGADRWDTTAHLGEDPRRRRAVGATHKPRHEVMAMADGEIAAAFGQLFRDRWAAVAESPPPAVLPAAPSDEDPWPPGLAPDLSGARLALARTTPGWRGRRSEREIAALTLEAIAEARSLIYLENQYFTWPLAVEALAARLAEPDGPEVVLVCTGRSPSYFDRITMDRARSTSLWRLKSSDVFGRFHALAPYAADGRAIIAHAKVMVVDDTLARVSSANLNNRSHGFDTECELAIEADAPADRAALAAFRDGLAGHWVGHTAADMAEIRRLSGSLAEGLWALDGGQRLRALEPRRLGPVGEFIAEFHIGDPTEVGDSLRPFRRREKLLAEARALRLAFAAPD